MTSLRIFLSYDLITNVTSLMQVLVNEDPGLTGNLLVERLVGAHVELISKEEYAKIGSVVC